jgi:hypothetical protein
MVMSGNHLRHGRLLCRVVAHPPAARTSRSFAAKAFRLAGLAVLGAEEAAVIAREADRLGAKALGCGEGATVRQLALRLLAGGHDDPCRCGPQGVDVGLVVALVIMF